MTTQYHRFLNKSIAASAHCQRNWDLSKEISKEDMETIFNAATMSPSKQGLPYFTIKATTDRDIIEEVFKNTSGMKSYYDFMDDEDEKTKLKSQSQVLGNLLIAFFEDDAWKEHSHRTSEYDETKSTKEEIKTSLAKNLNTSIGIAAGYTKFTAELLGLRSGCCSCFDKKSVQRLFDEPEKRPILLMGIGYGDDERPRTEHHRHGHRVKPLRKDIQVEMI